MNIKRILLIEPQAAASHVYSLVRMPRLGLPLLGAQLKELGYQVNLLYGKSREIKVADLLQNDLVGISTTTSTCKEAYKIASIVRNRGIPVVLGGVHATFMAEEALQYADYVCRGEADFTFAQLLECLNRGEQPYQVPGVSFYDQEQNLIQNPLPDWVDITKSPVPDLTLFTNADQISTYPVLTSRGCPHRCTFCSVTQMFGHQYRCRSVQQVLAELERYRGRNLFFCDDNFTANPIRTKTILKEMIKQDLLPKWWGAQVRAEAAQDEELLSLMRQARCGTVYVGLESINPLTLQAFHKQQDVADIRYCVENFHKYGIKVHGMFVFGGDEDSVATIRETVDFALETKIDTVQFMILVPLPGTPVYTQLDQEGRLLTKDWDFYDGHHVVFQPKQMSPWELQTETINAFRRFYAIRNLPRNLFVTGFSSVVFRGIGYYLVRKWTKECGWYQQWLQNSVLQRPQVARSFRIRNYVRMQIVQEGNGITVELQGYLSSLAWSKIVRVIKANLIQHRLITVNAANLNFPSEQVVKNFVHTLNRWAETSRVQVRVPDLKLLVDVLERNNLTIPNFEYSVQ